MMKLHSLHLVCFSVFLRAAFVLSHFFIAQFYKTCKKNSFGRSRRLFLLYKTISGAHPFFRTYNRTWRIFYRMRLYRYYSFASTRPSVIRRWLNLEKSMTFSVSMSKWMCCPMRKVIVPNTTLVKRYPFMSIWTVVSIPVGIEL